METLPRYTSRVKNLDVSGPQIVKLFRAALVTRLNVRLDCW